MDKQTEDLITQLGSCVGALARAVQSLNFMLLSDDARADMRDFIERYGEFSQMLDTLEPQQSDPSCPSGNPGSGTPFQGQQ